MFDILTVGDTTVDIFLSFQDKGQTCAVDHQKKQLCFPYGEKICVKNHHETIGGNAANVAVGIATLGASTAILTETGKDMYGHIIETTLKKKGVETNYIIQNNKRNTRSAIILNTKEERTILSIHDNIPYTTPKNIPKSHWIYFTSLGPSSHAIQKIILQYKKKYPHTTLCVNPGSHQIHDGYKTFKEILPHTDVCILNKEEAQIIAPKEKTIKSLISSLHKKGPHSIVITDNTDGSYMSDGKQIYHMPSYNTTVIAKTGAGDAYAAGFIFACMQKYEYTTAMQYGTANASSVIEHIGAQTGLLTETLIKKRIKKYPHITPRIL